MISFQLRREAHFIFIEQLNGSFVVEKDGIDMFITNKVGITEVQNLLRMTTYRIVVFDVDGNLKAKNYI
ncbi:hypothetical protein KIOSHI_259 [Bacillus phage Kioshi]|nr:hypothetical protein KIOSHI_3 [Bacillus phage Kioshi]AXQ67875.1 hypothetical protein KIOSHI_259 [Bacillus phage Kioshi]